MTRPSVLGLCATLGGVAMLACSPAPDVAPTTTRRDSAGVTIIDQRPPRPGEVAEWSVEQPLFAIGADTSGEAMQFTNIVGLGRFSDGGVAVLDRDSRGEIDGVRTFDAHGVFQSLLGKKGGGPGETANIGGMGVVRGDTVLVYDNYRNRVLFFDRGGAFVRSESLLKPRDPGISDLPLFQFEGAFADGTLLMARHPGERSVPRGETLDDSIRPMRIRANGDPVAVLARLWYRRLGWVKVSFKRPGASSSLEDGFMPLSEASFGVVGDGMFYFDPRSSSITRYAADGTPRFVLHLDLATPPVAPPTEYRGWNVDTPARGVFGDRDGNLWVIPHSAAVDSSLAGKYLVFDSTGSLRGVASLAIGRRGCISNGSSTIDVGGGFVACWTVDSLHVATVVVARIGVPRR